MQTTEDFKLLGFSSFKDVLNALFGSRKKYHMKTILLFTFSFATLTKLLEAWVWSPAWTLIPFTAILVWDFAGALTVAIKDGEGWQTDKATKFVFSVFAYWMLLAISFNMGSLTSAFQINVISTQVFSTFAISLYFFCFFVNLSSALRHMVNLGLIKGKVADFVNKFIDVQKKKLEAKVTTVDDEPNLIK